MVNWYRTVMIYAIRANLCYSPYMDPLIYGIGANVAFSQSICNRPNTEIVSSNHTWCFTKRRFCAIISIYPKLMTK
jgi:hypothetical protein